MYILPYEITSAKKIFTIEILYSIAPFLTCTGKAVTWQIVVLAGNNYLPCE